MKILIVSTILLFQSVQAYEYREYEVAAVTDEVWNFTPMDIDGNGVNEVLFQEDLNSLFSYYFSPGLTVDKILIGSFDCEIYSLAVKDIDEDGFDDITLLCYDLSEDLFYVKELYNLAGSGFQLIEAGSFYISSEYAPLKIGLSDIDADGDFDITMLNSRFVGWLTNEDGSFIFNTIKSLVFSGYHSQAGQFVDMDGDNDLDFVDSTCILLTFSCHPEGTKILYFDEINGEFSTELVLSEKYYQGIKVADMNQDGLLEVIASPNPVNGNLEMIKFQQPSIEIIDLGFEMYGQFSLVDMNNDEIVDLIELNEGNIYFNTGQPSFTTQFIGGEIKSIADYNGDGLMDMVIEKNHPTKGVLYLFLLVQNNFIFKNGFEMTM